MRALHPPSAARRRQAFERPLRLIACVLLLWSSTSSPIRAQTAEAPTLDVIRSQYVRMPVGRDIQRMAVGDQTIAGVEIVTSRELLVLGRDTGRTSLIVWFTDGTLIQRLIVVRRDLTLLQAALHQVHPSLTVESAPDRDALVLSGRVPDFATSQRAEAIARSYLDAGQSRLASIRPLLAAAGSPAPVAGGPADPTAAAGAPVAVQGELPPTGSVINLVQLDALPLLPEERISRAIASLGGERVTVRRVLRGNLRDDDRDTLVLEGEVATQIVLVRVLQLAAQVFAGTAGDDDLRIEAVTDEGGGLLTQVGAAAGQGAGAAGAGIGIGGAAGGALGGARGGGAVLRNDIQRNVGRATTLRVADGRILSFVRVLDLPQIRVNVRVFEVNRERLRSRTPVTGALGTNLTLPSADPSPAAAAAQGTSTKARAEGSNAVQNVLAFLSGGFLNEFQFTGNNFAITQALALLERAGVARTLSSPTLTVLSGESARFQVGGEVPVAVAFTPAIGGQTPAPPGLFTAVDFVSFGLQLAVRPLVGEGDSITVDVQPRVVSPDAALTASLRETTGSNQVTTAFATRALQTTSRLADGQAILIGGLTSRSASRTTSKTPGLGDVPGIGQLFRGATQSDDASDLVVVINPVILRTPEPRTPLWAFPTPHEFLPRRPDAGAAPDTSPTRARPR